jgi:hypothetical protein
LRWSPLIPLTKSRPRSRIRKEPSGAKNRPLHVNTVCYWMVHACIGGAHRYILVHADTSDKWPCTLLGAWVGGVL